MYMRKVELRHKPMVGYDSISFFVKMATLFNSAIKVITLPEHKLLNAKSIFDIQHLRNDKIQHVNIFARGDDASKAVDMLSELLKKEDSKSQLSMVQNLQKHMFN